MHTLTAVFCLSANITHSNKDMMLEFWVREKFFHSKQRQRAIRKAVQQEKINATGLKSPQNIRPKVGKIPYSCINKHMRLIMSSA